MKRSPVSALALLILGIIFLLNNFGYLSWDLWNSVWKFWPVLLILISLEMLFTRKGSGQLLLTASIIIFAVPFFLQGQKLPFNFNFGFLPGQLTSGTTPLIQKLGTLIEGKIDIQLSSGKLKINSLNKQATDLYNGELKYNKIVTAPKVNFEPKDGIGNLAITASQGSLPVDLSSNDWTLSLSQVVPFSINIKDANSSLDLDLSNLKINNLKFDLGKTTTKIVVPNAGNTHLDLTASEGSITIQIPAGLPARINIPDNASSGIDARFAKTQNGYQVGNFDNAADRIDLKINPGQAKVTVK